MALPSKRSWQVAKVFNNAWMCTSPGSAPVKVLTLNLEESSARRIALRGIAMESDDMFFGHCITAYGTLADGVTAANMEGECRGLVQEWCPNGAATRVAQPRPRPEIV